MSFYSGVALDDPAYRDRFADPARTVLDDADRLAKTGEGACLDRDMATDGVVMDDEALHAVKTIEAVTGDRARVVAAFAAGGEGHHMEWQLTRSPDGWKIADLLSATNDWALSQYHCE